MTYIIAELAGTLAVRDFPVSTDSVCAVACNADSEKAVAVTTVPISITIPPTADNAVTIAVPVTVASEENVLAELPAKFVAVTLLPVKWRIVTVIRRLLSVLHVTKNAVPQVVP